MKNGLFPTTDLEDDLLRRTQVLYDKTKKNAMQSYIRYKKHYDKNTEAPSFQEKDYCYVLQAKADDQGSKLLFREFTWIDLYVVKVLPNENCLLRKLNSNKTQFYIASDFAK